MIKWRIRPMLIRQDSRTVYYQLHERKVILGHDWWVFRGDSTSQERMQEEMKELIRARIRAGLDEVFYDPNFQIQMALLT